MPMAQNKGIQKSEARVISSPICAGPTGSHMGKDIEGSAIEVDWVPADFKLQLPDWNEGK